MSFEEVLSKVKIDMRSSNMKEMKEVIQRKMKELDDIKKDETGELNDPKLKKYTAVFDDENTKLAEDPTVQDKSDREMSKKSTSNPP